VSAADKGGSWVNSRRRKSSRPQWHYEGTVLDKSQRLTAVNGSEDYSLTAWDGQVDPQGSPTDPQGSLQGDEREDQAVRNASADSAADDDDVRSEVNSALSNCVTSH